MPSSYTLRGRFTLQATGENGNTWGIILNSGVFELLDVALNGVLTLTGSTTLTTANGADDQARYAGLNYTGTSAGTITIPPVEKIYQVRAATADCIITNGSSSVTVQAGSGAVVMSDGTDIWKIFSTDFAGQRGRNFASPIANSDAATKKYVDDTAFATQAGSYPAMTGNALKFFRVKADESAPEWADPLPAREDGKFLKSTVSGEEWAEVPDLTAEANTWAEDQTLSKDLTVVGETSLAGLTTSDPVVHNDDVTLNGALLLASGGPTDTAQAGHAVLKVNTITASRDLALDDAEAMIRSAASGTKTLTIQPHSTTPLPVGFTCLVRVYIGVITVARGTGVALRAAGSSSSSNYTLASSSYATLTQEDTDVWVVSGVL